VMVLKNIKQDYIKCNQCLSEQQERFDHRDGCSVQSNKVYRNVGSNPAHCRECRQCRDILSEYGVVGSGFGLCGQYSSAHYRTPFHGSSIV
jgi:hypothetical protein